MLAALCLTALAVTTGYHVAAVAAAMRWRRRIPPVSSGTLSLTLLKPLRGADPELFENLQSFAQQDYLSFRLVLGALDSQDPALDIAREIALENPDVDIQIVAGGEPIGLNRKVATLVAMLPLASGELLVLSDSDMRVRPDYLTQIAAEFDRPEVGLVTCLYRGAEARGLASKLEALGIGEDFAPSVLLANSTAGMAFAFGSTIALRRSVLAEIGGLESIKDEIADDYLLGAKARALGHEVVLSSVVVETVLGRQAMGEMLGRRLRWAKTVRAMRPMGYFGLLTAQTLPICAAATILTQSSAVSAAACAAYAVRVMSAAWIALRCTGDREVASSIWLLPVSDLVGFCLWLGGFLGGTIVWRGERFRLGSGGKLSEIRRPPAKG